MPLSRINTNSIANNTIQGADVLDASITAAKIVSIANTQITGNIVSSQITSVGGSQITANTIANSAFQTGSVENYMNAAGLGFGMRNRIINGAMGIWQRGTSLTSSSYAYLADRWANGVWGTNTTASQSSSVPSSGFQYSLKMQRPSGATSTGIIGTLQTIESVNCYDLSSQTVTLSFWAKAGTNYSGASSALGVQINTGTAADQGGLTYGTWTGLATSSTSVTLTTSWQKFTYTATFGAGVLESAIVFYYVPVGTAGADDSFFVTGVQLEKGSTATSFDYRPYGTELALCQRYYCKSYQQSVAPATSTTLGVTGVIASTASLLVGGFNTWPVTMRTTPTVTIYSQTGTSGKLSAPGAVDTGTSVISETPSEKGAVGINSSGGFTIGSWYYGHFVATAEL